MSIPDARALFAAAREDRPDDVGRDEVFRRIAIVTGLASATGAAAGGLSAASSPAAAAAAAVTARVAEVGPSAVAATSVAAKTSGMLALELLAGVAALGAITTVLTVLLTPAVETPGATRAPDRLASAQVTARATVAPGARLAQPERRKRDPVDGTAEPTASAARGPEARGAAGSFPTAVSAGASAGPSDLAEEARLVTAARNALVAGNAARALVLVQAARKWKVRSLEPEELGLEARALRALGRADEAAATELLLRRRHPEHALAR